MELAPLTVLNKRYTIKRTLGDPGPFDILYLGQDVDSKEQYVIREFFPASLVKRESEKTSVEVKGGDDEADLFQSGLDYYEKESSVLSSLTHDALPSGYVTFEANGTFYRARPHQPSMSLTKGLESKGKLSEKAALTIMIPILEALQEAHDQGLYHGGVSPSTVRLLEDGKVLLTGFRGAFIQLARQRGELSALVQPGTSAIEQYTPRGNQGPWTDVYAAAATICQMVTGEPLPEATDRLEGEDPIERMIQDAAAFSSPGVREALVDALAVDPSKRLQAAGALMNALKESSTRYDESEPAYTIIPVEPEDDATEDDEEVEVLSTGEPDRSARASTSRSRRTRKEESSNNMALLVGIPVLVLVLGGGAWFLFSSGSSAASGSYAEYRSRADSLFASENYSQAEEAYRQALQVREGDQYVEQRLDRISQMQQTSSAQRYERQMARGDSLKAVADQRFDQGNVAQANRVYSQAMAAYFSALESNPSDQTAEQRIDQIEQRQTAIARQQASSGSGDVDLDQIATFFQEQGNRQMGAGNLQAALRKYKQALEYKPNDAALRQTVTDLEQEIADQRQNREFQRHFDRGQEMMQQENYAEALAAFEKAAEVKPDDSDLQEAMSRAQKLEKQQAQTQAAYREHRSAGDEAYQEGNYEQAIQAYKKALEEVPGDGYVEEQLEKAKRELEEVRLAQSKQKKDAERRKNMVGEDGIYKVVDQEPSVKGGLAALHRNVRYPESAARRGIEGRVYIEAVVNADGTVRDAKVTSGIGGGCDREAMRVVENAEFNAAKVDGKTVPARTTVWIEFALKN